MVGTMYYSEMAVCTSETDPWPQGWSIAVGCVTVVISVHCPAPILYSPCYNYNMQGTCCAVFEICRLFLRILLDCVWY